MSTIIETVLFILAFIVIELFGIDAALIIAMWLTFACIGLGLIGEFVIRPWREGR